MLWRVQAHVSSLVGAALLQGSAAPQIISFSAVWGASAACSKLSAQFCCCHAAVSRCHSAATAAAAQFTSSGGGGGSRAMSSSAGSSEASSSSNSNSSSGSSPARSGNAPLAPPWTPSSRLVKRKAYTKRARFLVQTLEAEQQQRLAAGRQLPPFRAGDVLEVTTVVPEADRRRYTHRGVVIARGNKGPRSWFKLYNVFPDAGGFVQHFPLYMPDLLSLRVVGRLPKARRSKLYHLLADEGPKHVYQGGSGALAAGSSGSARGS